MTRLLMAATVAALLGCGPAAAQVGGSSPLGMTSPLGIGPAPAVAPTGIPLGATELASPGVSPMTSGVSPLSPLGAVPGSACAGLGSPTAGMSSGIATSTAGTSGSTAIFDGGGTAGTASGTCAGIASSPVSGPAASASSPTGMGSAPSVGRVGIPLGSTELGAGGLSPPPDVLTANPSVPLSTSGTTFPCPTIGMSPTSGVASGSC
jgi:hypothetical protein